VLIYTFRGIVNKTLTPEMALKIGCVAGRSIKEEGSSKIFVSGDHRDSTLMLKCALSAGFFSEGLDVVDLGTTPTGVLSHLVRKHAVPGVMVTASHNPGRWNGMQFHETDSHIYGPDKEAEIKEMLDVHIEHPPVTKRRFEHYEGAAAEYLDSLCAMALQKSKGLKKRRKIKIIFDSGHSTATLILPQLFKRLGVTHKEIHGGLDSSYLDTLSANISEPGPQSFQELRRAVIDEKADAGFAFDCDSDRFVVINEKGRFVEGDRTILLIAEHLFTSGDVVSNVCTSLVTENILRRKGFRIHHERWGQTFIGDCIRKNGAVLGFEPDGHFIYPELSLHADGIASAAFFTAALSGMKTTLSAYVASLPPTFIEREKIEWNNDLVHHADKIDSLLRKKYGGYRRLHDRLFMALTDARKLVIRQSPFDSSLRISAEAPSRKAARQMVQEAEEIFR